MAKDIGVLTEQGDLGFGFDLLNESDQAQYDKAQKDKNNNSSEDNKN